MPVLAPPISFWPGGTKIAVQAHPVDAVLWSHLRKRLSGIISPESFFDLRRAELDRAGFSPGHRSIRMRRKVGIRVEVFHPEGFLAPVPADVLLDPKDSLV